MVSLKYRWIDLSTDLETLVHKSIVIIRRITKTQCKWKVLIVSTIVSSVVSFIIIIIRIKMFPFPFCYDYDAYNLE